MRQATLCFLVKGNQVLLGMKKRGFGEGKWNGFGGKVKEGESVENCLMRELREEAGVRLAGFEKAAELTFILPGKPEWSQVVQVFLCEKWAGKEKETDEMMPQWFEKEALPFEQMWGDDRHWLPLVLKGEKIEGRFTFNDDNETIKEFEIKKAS